MNLILCGFKHSGKTHFGTRLAARLSKPFIDTDRLIEAREEITCRELVLTRGVAEFRRAEEQAILSLTAQHSIIALGGGAPLNPRLLPHLLQLGTLVLLVPDLNVLRARYQTLPRPYYMETTTFEEMVAERQPLYDSLPAHRVLLAGKTDDEVLQELARIIPDNLEQERLFTTESTEDTEAAPPQN